MAIGRVQVHRERGRCNLATLKAIPRRRRGSANDCLSTEFCDRYGDWGRDLARHIGRREGGMKLRELGEKAGAMDYGSVAIALHRFGKKLKEHPPLRTAHQKIQKLIVIK
jgi:hypothetical protein